LQLISHRGHFFVNPGADDIRYDYRDSEAKAQ